MLSKNNSINRYMSLAILLAKQRIGLTGENPSVGCVIVKNKKVISYGQTGFGGTPHAEINAINNSSESLKGSSIFISLEPCNHYGKTPPCTNRIIKSKFKNVYYGINDIDKRTSGNSEKILKKKGIVVHKNVMSKKIYNLYKSYFYLKRNKFPYITGKIACSKNFIINSKERYISNNESLKVSHLLRFRNQGILISSSTLNDDNPKLDCRINGLETFSPIRFIIDKSLKIKINSNIVKSSKKIKTYIFYNKTSKKLKILKKKGLKLILSPLNSEGNIDLKSVLSEIRNKNINYLLVEGGDKLTKSLLKANYFNEFYLFKSKKILKTKNNSIKINRIIKNLSKSFRFKKDLNTNLNGDKIIKYV